MLSQMTLQSWHLTMWWWSSVGFLENRTPHNLCGAVTDRNMR